VPSRDSNPGPVLSIPGFGIGGISNPGIPAGLWDPGGIISKNVIIEYNGPIVLLLILRLLSQSHRHASRLL